MGHKRPRGKFLLDFSPQSTPWLHFPSPHPSSLQTYTALPGQLGDEIYVQRGVRQSLSSLIACKVEKLNLSYSYSNVSFYQTHSQPNLLLTVPPPAPLVGIHPQPSLIPEEDAQDTQARQHTHVA